MNKYRKAINAMVERKSMTDAQENAIHVQLKDTLVVVKDSKG